MDLREILFAQFPAFFLLSLLFLIAHLRVRKHSAVKSVLWVLLFGAARGGHGAADVVVAAVAVQLMAEPHGSYSVPVIRMMRTRVYGSTSRLS